LHPFDIKNSSFREAWPQHVVLIHFPIALFIIGVLFDFLAHGRSSVCCCGGLLQLARRGDRNHTRGSHRNSRVAVELEGQKLKGILLMHLVMGCLSSVLICMVWFIHMRTRRRQEEVLPGYTACRSRLWP